MAPHWKTLVVLLTLWAVRYPVAWYSLTLTRDQMRWLFPTGSILPLAWHWGQWLDLPLAFILAGLVYLHQADWDRGWMTMIAIISFIGTVTLFLQGYTRETIPGSDVQNGVVMWPGWIHAAYAAFAIMIIISFYALSQNPAPWLLIAVSAYLVFHVAASCHFIPYWLHPEDYTKNPFEDVPTWIAIGGTAALVTIATILRWPK